MNLAGTGGVKPGAVEPGAGAAAPTIKSNSPYTVTEATAPAFRRKSRLPSGGEWEGVPGESIWLGPDKSVPGIRFERQYPVYPSVNGVEVKINMVGRIDTARDFRRASASGCGTCRTGF